MVLLSEPASGSYEGFDPLRDADAARDGRGAALGVRALCGDEELELVEVSSRGELEAGEPRPGTARVLYEEAPAVETWAPAKERVLAEMVAGVHGAPRVSVRLPRVDVRKAGASSGPDLRGVTAGTEALSPLRPAVTDRFVRCVNRKFASSEMPACAILLQLFHRAP